MAVRASFFILCLFFNYSILSAQERYLLINKPGFKHDVTYYEGDPIQFCMKGEHLVRHDKIIGFTDSTIVFDSYSVKPGELKFVRIERKGGLVNPSNGIKLILAGVALIGADYLNYSIIRGFSYHADKGMYIISGALITAGLLLTPTKYHKFRASWKNRFQIMND